MWGSLIGLAPIMGASYTIIEAHLNYLIWPDGPTPPLIFIVVRFIWRGDKGLTGQTNVEPYLTNNKI